MPIRGCLHDPAVLEQCPQAVLDAIHACLKVGAGQGWGQGGGGEGRVGIVWLSWAGLLLARVGQAGLASRPAAD